MNTSMPPDLQEEFHKVLEPAKTASSPARPSEARNRGYEAKAGGGMPKVDLSVIEKDFTELDNPLAERASRWSEQQVAALKRVNDESVRTADGELFVKARYEVEYIHGEPSRLKTRALQKWLKDPANRYEPTDDVIRAAKASSLETIKRLPRNYVDREGRDELLRRYEAAYYREVNTRHPDEPLQRDQTLLDEARKYGLSSADNARRHNPFQRLQRIEDVVHRYEVGYINDAISERFQRTVESVGFVRYEATPTIKRAARLAAESSINTLEEQDPNLFERLSSDQGGKDSLIRYYEAQYLRNDQFYDDANAIYDLSRARYESKNTAQVNYEASPPK